jgi:hypothetical protein
MAVQFEGVQGFWLIGAIRTTCRDPNSAETHSYTSTPAWPVILDLFWLISAIRTTCLDPDSAETHSYTSTPAWPVILDLFWLIVEDLHG